MTVFLQLKPLPAATIDEHQYIFSVPGLPIDFQSTQNVAEFDNILNALVPADPAQPVGLSSPYDLSKYEV